LAGAFIEKQVLPNNFEEAARQASELTSEEDLIKRREELWEDFCKVVKVIYPFPIRDCEDPGQIV
jgi:hypothetical protein